MFKTGIIEKVENPTFLMITVNGIIFLLFSILSVILGYLFDSILLILFGLPFLITFIAYTRSVLMYKSVDIDLTISFPSTQIKAKQFLAVLISIHCSENIIGLVQIEQSDGLFPVVKPSTTTINTEKKSNYTFLFYAPKRGKEIIKRISIKFYGLLGFFYLEKRIGLNREIIVLPEPQRVTLPWTHKQKILDQLIAEVSTVNFKIRNFG